MLISIEGHSVADFDTQSAFNRWWTTTFKASWIQSTLYDYRLYLDGPAIRWTKLRNWWFDTHTMMTSFDINDFMSNFWVYVGQKPTRACVVLLF